MAKFSKRGIIILFLGMILAVSGAYFLDYSYKSVESIMLIKHDIVDNSEVLPHQSVNSLFSNEQLVDHNVLIVHVKPESDSIKLIVTEPNNETFEKESSDGFAYHIIGKNSQTVGNYSLTVYDLSNEPVIITALIGEDPYLSGKCFSSSGVNCYAVPTAIGLVIVGVIAFVVGGLLIFTEFRKKRLGNK